MPTLGRMTEANCKVDGSFAPGARALADWGPSLDPLPRWDARLKLKILVAGVLAGALWVAAWVWFLRYNFLDDAFIHLRYAELLWQHGFLTFDGVHRSDGCSSLLYVGLLALAHGLGGGVFAGKIASICCYAFLLGTVVCAAAHSKGTSRLLWSALAVILISPMAARWLTDGMETSFAGAASLALALAACRIRTQTTISPARYAGLLLLGFGIVILRIDLALLIASATLGVCISQLDKYDWKVNWGENLKGLAGLALRVSHLAAGGAAACLVIYCLTGHLLPDTAIAKAHGGSMHLAYVLSVLSGTLRAFMGSLSFGLGLLILWVVSLGVAVRSTRGRRMHRWSLLPANLPLALWVLLILTRGQVLHGVRYFVAPSLFMIAWNIEAGSGSGESLRKFEGRIFPRIITVRALAGMAAALVIAGWCIEGAILVKVTQIRARSFLQMRSHHLEFLAGKPGLAADIGMIAYFSKGRIFDLSGLVQGRDFAKAPERERVRYGAAQSPVFIYMTAAQMSPLDGVMDVHSWAVCHRYLFMNVDAAADPKKMWYYYLLVRPDYASALCPSPMLTKAGGPVRE